MADAAIHLTDAEFAVLEPLWQQGAQTIRQLTARIYPGQSVSDYATVQKLLERLEAKGCVARNRAGLAHVFRATIERERLIGQQLQEIADRLCEGSWAPMLSQLVRRAGLSKKDREQLRKLLESGGSDKKPSPGGDRT